eukprot:553299_1
MTAHLCVWLNEHQSSAFTMMVQFQLIHIMMGESLMVFTIMVEYQLNQWNILQMIICDIICVMLIGYGSAVQTAFITLLIDVMCLFHWYVSTFATSYHVRTTLC